MDTVERRARLEARLKGWTFDTMCVFHNPYCVWDEDNEGTHGTPTDPTTPEGAISWLALMVDEGFAVHFDVNAESYEIRMYGPIPNTEYSVIEIDDGLKSIPAAVTAAVDALALREFPDA